MSFLAPIVSPVLSAIGVGSGSGPAASYYDSAAAAAKSSADADASAQDLQRRLNRGRSSTMLNGGSGLSDLGTTSKTLLGQ